MNASAVALLPTVDLILAASGAVDLNEAAAYELARRGRLPSGLEVGKRAALADWLAAYGDPSAALSWCDSCLDVLLPVGAVCQNCGHVQTARSSAAPWLPEGRSFTETPAAAWEKITRV